MSYLRGSANYVWCTTSVLGKGATGAVFQGVSKHDGEPVAVKTFNQLSHMRPQEVQVREFEVLKKVKHENIVKLLAIEEEQDGRGKVIVMELCTGGSLYNLLDHPENTYGLSEDDFLLVLSHLSAGMKHLRDNKLVHRDLKPGNIMKYVAEDGRIIFKLTDFGAARELEEDQEFVSLYGTEEYLHPDMYERAVLRKPVGKTFSASVDLWSIGVTLYHVATGYLPFRPYGGRKNKEMMHFITTKKESGVISGVQTTENGPVDWKRDLPNSCQLNTGLKLLVTPLLAGLMEADQRKRWTYDSFFSAVQRILNRTVVHIFYVNKIQTLRVYMDPQEHSSLMSFQNLVMEQTDISGENQMLLYKDINLTSLLDQSYKPSSSLPVTTDESPLILCHRENNNVSLDWDVKDLLKFPTFPNLVNVENDASLAKLCCSVGYSYKRRVEKICRSVNLITLAVETIDKVITAELATLSKDTNQTQSVVHSIGQQLGLMGLFHKTCQSFLTAIPNADKEKSVLNRIESMGKANELQHNHFRQLTAKLTVLEQPIKQLFHRFAENETLKTEWSEPIADVKDISRASKKAASHVAKLQDSWQHLLRDRATRSLTYNDEQFHILERIKMQEKSKCLAELLNEECQLVIIKLTEVLSDWYKQAQAAFIQTEILAKDMIQFEKSMSEFLKNLDDAMECYQTDLELLTNGLKQLHQQNKLGGSSKEQKGEDYSVKTLDTDFNRTGKSKGSPNRSSSREHAKSMKKGIKDLHVLQEEVWRMVKENADLVNQFQGLALSLFSSEDSPYPPSLNTPEKSESDVSVSGKSE